MVRRVLSLIYKEIQGLHQAAYVLALFAFGSQLLALVRDRILAHQFGAGAELDLYYIAFRIPDLLYVLFASALSVYVLIPFVSKRTEDDGNASGSELLSQIFSLFLLLYCAMAIVIAVFAPTLVAILFPGLEAGSETVVTLLRILLIQPLLLGISSLFGVVTQLSHRFVLYAISPLLYNLGIIFGIAALYPLFGMTGLALGVVLGALGHLLVQYPLVRTSQYSIQFVRTISWKTILPVLRVSIPRAATLSLNQVVLLGFVGLASLMTVGSVSVFQFAYNLQSVPLTIIGVSYSVAAFPTLAQLIASKEMEKFRLHVLTAMRHIIFWSVPAIVLCIVLRAQIVRVILGSGAFDWSDTRLTAAVFALLVFSLVGQALLLLMIRASYAGGNTRLPFIVTLGGAVLSLGGAVVFLQLFTTYPALSVSLAHILRLETVVGIEVVVLAIAFSLSTILQAMVLTVLLTNMYRLSFVGILKGLGEAVLAAVVGGSVAYLTLNFIVDGINTATFIGIFIQGLLAGIAGVVMVALTYHSIGSQEFTEILQSFRRRIFKTDVLAPHDDVL